MKGIVFTLLGEAVIKAFDEDTWDDLLEAAHLDGSYTSLGTYPDEHFRALVAAAAEKLGMSERDIIRWAGQQMIPLMVEKYGEFFEAHDNTRDFLLTLNNVIHPEVRKLYPGADVPEFGFDTSSEETLVMTYVSGRKLCDFGVGLIEGASIYYKQTVHLEHPKCLHNGDEHCVFEISFE